MIDAHEPRVGSDFDALMQVARGYGVQRAPELNVVIPMHGGPGPRGPIEGRRRQRQERRPFHGLEHDAGDLARGAVHAGAGQIPTPPDGAGLHVGHIVEGLAAEKILAGVRNPALHTGLAPRVLGDGGVDDEAAVLRVLKEDAVQAGRVAIGPGDRGGEIVDDEAAHDAAKERPRRFQAVEDGREILPQADRQKGVATAAQRHEQAVDAPTPLRVGVEPVSQHTKVGFRPLPRRRIGDADGERRGAEVARHAREPVQRTVGHSHTRCAETAIDLGQAQAVRQPLPDRRLVRTEELEFRTGRVRVRRPPRPARRGDLGELLVGGRRAPALDAERDGRLDIGGNRLAVHPRGAGDRPDAVAAQPPSKNLSHFHHPELPIGHGPSFRRAAWPGRPGWRNVSEQVGDSF